MSSRLLIRYIVYAIIIIFIIAAIKIAGVYKEIYGPNIKTPEKKEFFLYIPTGSTYEDVIALLEVNQIIRDRKTFEWAASKKKYPGAWRPVSHLFYSSTSATISLAGLSKTS